MTEDVQTYPEGYVAGGRYELSYRLGTGGMGSVYLAHDRNIGKKVAVKFLDPSLTDNKELIKRFEREARIAASIRHENICDVTDYGVNEERVPYLVMEYLEGEALTARLDREGKMAPSTAGEILLQVLDALVVVHKAGIVHRDLKPDNIFLTLTARGKTRVKLIDFGIAKVSDATGTKTAYGRVMGTVYYMSPEQAEGSVDRIDHRTDIWSSGVILYEILTARLPFTGDTLREIMGGILFREPPTAKDLDPSVPDPLSAVIKKAMAKERDARFPDAVTFANDLEEALKNPTTTEFERRTFAPTPSKLPPTMAPSTPDMAGSSMGAAPSTPAPAMSPSSSVMAHSATATAPPAQAAYPSSAMAQSAPAMYSPGTSTEGVEVAKPQKRGMLALLLVLAVVVLLGGGAAVAVTLALTEEPVAPPPVASTTEPTEPEALTPLEATESASMEPTAQPTSSDAGATEADAPAPPEVEVMLSGLPEDTELTFDGDPVTDHRLRGAAGTEGELVIRADGYEEHRREVTLREGLELDLSGALERRAQRRASRDRRRPRQVEPEPEQHTRSSTRWPSQSPRRDTGSTVRGGWESTRPRPSPPPRGGSGTIPWE